MQLAIPRIAPAERRMAESREFANAASESSAAYALYVLRATAHATRILQLLDQVVACVARRQLTPETLEQSLAAVGRTRAASLERDAKTAAARFVAGLVSSAIIPVDASEPRVDVDPSELDAALERVEREAVARSAAALATYQSRIDSVVAGELSPDDSRRAIRKDYTRGLSRELIRASQLWFELLGDLDHIRARFTEEYLLDALRRANPIGFHGDTVELTGRLNTTASTIISLENTRREPVVLRCAVRDVRRADAIGPAFVPNIVLDPSEVVVDADRAASIGVSLWLDDAIYAADARYVGAFEITRDGAPRIDVPLSITPMTSQVA